MAHQVGRAHRALSAAVALAALLLATGLAATVAAAHPGRAHNGILTGAIHIGGGGGDHNNARAGDVSVFTASGRLFARQHVRAGHQFHFKLAPGSYMLNAGMQMRYKWPLGCRPVKARVRALRTSRVDVFVGCGFV